jgi:hypothetical protein
MSTRDINMLWCSSHSINFPAFLTQHTSNFSFLKTLCGWMSCRQKNFLEKNICHWQVTRGVMTRLRQKPSPSSPQRC